MEKIKALGSWLSAIKGLWWGISMIPSILTFITGVAKNYDWFFIIPIVTAVFTLTLVSMAIIKYWALSAKKPDNANLMIALFGENRRAREEQPPVNIQCWHYLRHQENGITTVSYLFIALKQPIPNGKVGVTFYDQEKEPGFDKPILDDKSLYTVIKFHGEVDKGKINVEIRP